MRGVMQDDGPHVQFFAAAIDRLVGADEGEISPLTTERFLIREREFHLASRFGTAKLTGSSSPDDQHPSNKGAASDGFLQHGKPRARETQRPKSAAAKAVYPMTAAVPEEVPENSAYAQGPLNPRVPRESVGNSPMANSK